MDRAAADPKSVERGRARRGAIVLALGGAFAFIVLTRLPLCPMAGLLGVPCPGCGLTRATLALLHGNLRQALQLHPLVLVIAPIFVWAVTSAAYSYVRGPRPSPSLKPWLASRLATALAFALLALTLGVWSARFCGYFGGPAPVETFSHWTHAHLATGGRAPNVTR